MAPRRRSLLFTLQCAAQVCAKSVTRTPQATSFAVLPLRSSSVLNIRDEHKVVSMRVVGGDRNDAVHRQTLKTKQLYCLQTKAIKLIIISV